MPCTMAAPWWISGKKRTYAPKGKEQSKERRAKNEEDEEQRTKNKEQRAVHLNSPKNNYYKGV